MSQDYKQTLNLPQTEFPMKADLPVREPQWLERWEKERIYDQIERKRASGKPFILHDGPPFANGDVHIGTALNKILKDIIVKFKSMTGHRAPYLPGWDCHGLPIEFKVLKELREKNKAGDLSPVQIRKACTDYATHFIDVQRRQFKRLGVFGRWDSPYLTMAPAYEAEVLRVLADLVEKGFVYRGKKPVYWSIPCRTALAEAEVEYHDHVSPSIYVKFAVEGRPELAGTSAVIWTTTPWTIPANLAIAVHPDFEYGVYEHAGEKLLVGKALWERVAPQIKADPAASPSGVFKGRDLRGVATRHPFCDRISPIVLADYVTAESGTGLVHTAPGHGIEDYQTGLAEGLDIYSPVDDDGRFAADERMPAELVGKELLERKDGSQANAAVLALLKKKKALVGEPLDYTHSYPFCWRSKTPVIFRAMEQWFVGMDHERFRENMLRSVDEVRWIPDWGRNRIVGFLESRPDWCISRQRTWGVPIPAFGSAGGDMKLDAEVIRKFAVVAEKQGAGVWFEKSAEELAAMLGVPAAGPLRKSADTLDVWIESGSSHRAVLEAEKTLGSPADLYLEGSDQHRGWFQTSLSTSVATRGRPPFRSVLTHGFIVDLDGKKISKSGTYEKPKDSESFVKKYGADILRLWVSSQNYTNDIPLSEEILSHVGETYRRLRNTARILLGNLNGFQRGEEAALLAKATPIDRYVLSRLQSVGETVRQAYEAFEFHRVYHTLNAFCTVELSALYIDILKDRMYTFAPSIPERRSAQAVMAEAVRCLALWLAPILPFTAEEIWTEYQRLTRQTLGSVHMQDFPAGRSELRNARLEEQFEELKRWRDVAAVELENARRDKKIGKSLEARLVLRGKRAADLQGLGWNQSLLEEFFIVSDVDISPDGASGDREAIVELAQGKKCPRCWRVQKTVGTNASHPDICQRCAQMVEALAPAAG